MREAGLERAIEAVGGVGALARGLGIRQPSVSTWTKVPADRVLAVEALTGVARKTLRPDLFPTAVDSAPASAPAPAPIDEIELARAREYLLLARLLRQAPDAVLLAELARLRGDVSPLGMARMQLAEAAARYSEADIASEYFALFIGIGRGELLPYASFYLTGFLHEKPLANLRRDLRLIGIERADGNFDPEDHLGLLLEVMGGFANGTFDADLTRQKEFFDRHIAPWAERCFADIGVSPSANFYKAVAALGGCFIDLERAAFQIDD
jgi:TorA maturation chaperone TorD/DNA-binding transcriptional regulator YdaS (Cro superfamily)